MGAGGVSGGSARLLPLVSLAQLLLGRRDDDDDDDNDDDDDYEERQPSPSAGSKARSFASRRRMR